MLDMLIAKYPNMDQYEKDHLTAAVQIFQARIKKLKAADVVKIIRGVKDDIRDTGDF